MRARAVSAIARVETSEATAPLLRALDNSDTEVRLRAVRVLGRRLDETVPIGNAAMDERTFIEWDTDDIDALVTGLKDVQRVFAG